MSLYGILQISGVQSPTSLRSSSLHKPDTARSIGNSRPSTCWLNTFDTSLKVVNFHSSSITSQVFPEANPSFGFHFTIHLEYTPCEECSKWSSGCVILPTCNSITCRTECHHRLQRVSSRTGEWYRTCSTKIISFITHTQWHAITDVRFNNCLQCLNRCPLPLRTT